MKATGIVAVTVSFYDDRSEEKILEIINNYLEEGWTFSGVVYDGSQRLLFVKYE